MKLNLPSIKLFQRNVKIGYTKNIVIIIAGGVLPFLIGNGLALKDLAASFFASYYTMDEMNIGDKVQLNKVTGTISTIDKYLVTVTSADKDVIIPIII